MAKEEEKTKFIFPHHDGFVVRYRGFAAHRDHAKVKKPFGTHSFENQINHSNQTKVWEKPDVTKYKVANHFTLNDIFNVAQNNMTRK